MKELLRLFKAVVVKSKERKKASKELLRSTIERGFVFAPEVIANYSGEELEFLICDVEEEFTLTPQHMNASFHKSWDKIKNASMNQLVYEQLIHYFTTYGFEAAGIYDKNSVYIPNEKLNIPELKQDINIIVIHGYTKEEIQKKVMDMLGSGIALHEDTIRDIMALVKEQYVNITRDNIENIKNKEVKMSLYEAFNIVPEIPIEFLRYAIYKSTKSALLIKSKDVITKIKMNQEADIYKLFRIYMKTNSLEKLSEIFYRFKPLFLAFKSGNAKINSIINKIRKLAVKHHKPMPEDYLNTITGKIQNNIAIDVDKLGQELERVNIFRKIRLAYALKYRTVTTDSILYKIRNGKSFATEFNFKQKDEAKRIYGIVLKAIVKNMNHVKGKKVYIPANFEYALPATEKQYTGYIPSGSSVTVDKDMVFGVHWFNLKNDGYDSRVDIDISLINADGKIGWNGFYRTEDGDVLFSGDVTDAPEPNGGTELFYIRRQAKNAYIMMANYFNMGTTTQEVPLDIFIAKERISNINHNYMVDPNNVIATVKTKIPNKQIVLGLVVTSKYKNTFYFNQTGLGNSIASSNNKYTQQTNDYMFAYCEHAPTLNELLEKAGCILVTDKKECEIDLSPEALEKDTIMNLISKRG